MIVVAEAAAVDSVVETEAADDLMTEAEEAILIADLEKCTKQSVRDARRNVKCRSNLQKEETFFARIVLLRETKLYSLGNFF